jgi:hypothetical protein
MLNIRLSQQSPPRCNGLYFDVSEEHALSTASRLNSKPNFPFLLLLLQILFVTIILDPEDGGSTLLRNISVLLPRYATAHVHIMRKSHGFLNSKTFIGLRRVFQTCEKFMSICLWGQGKRRAYSVRYLISVSQRYYLRDRKISKETLFGTWTISLARYFMTPASVFYRKKMHMKWNIHWSSDIHLYHDVLLTGQQYK